jgi:sugar O-acyltransferase (sialic acid O-acetyltransferase NeuD family)
MKKIVIVGASASAREIMNVLEHCNQEEELYEALGYVVDPQYGPAGTMINDKPILGGFDWLEKHVDEVYVVLGIGPSHHRFQVAQRTDRIHCRYINFIHPWTDRYLSRWIKLGVGIMLNGCGCSSDPITLGNHVFVHGFTTVGHDVILNDFVTVSPGVQINGNVTLGEGCYIGSGVVFKEKVSVGAWSMIGAGSVVTKDIPANVTAVGSPARIISQQEPGWHLG